jgi:two-component system heavy metal sensor histidine kinase CusS
VRAFPWRPRFQSLSARLTFLYTVATVLLLATSAGVVYFVLAGNVRRQDELFLGDKVYVLRAILKNQPNQMAPLREEVQWEAGSRRNARYFSRVSSAEGELVMETPGMVQALRGASFPEPVREDQEWRRGSLWRPEGETYFLLGSAWAREGGPTGARRRLDVALDVSREMDLLEDYRHGMAVSLLVGLALSALLGLGVARRGLRPLEEMARAARAITPEQLHRRMGSEPWPTELRSLAEAFDDMLARLEEAFLRLATFSADLAHDLRTPIGNCLGEVEVALSKAREPREYQRILESNLEELSRISRMIDSLLFLARADNAQTNIERTVLEARREMEAMAELYEAVAEEQGVKLVLEGAGQVVADQTLLRRALGNLLSNALRHTPGGGTVILSSSSPEGGGCLIAISDSGEGVAEADLARLFDRFYRSEASRSRHPQGLGLGLSIVKSIMDLHGGTVRVKSRPGAGTTVTLLFPARI